MFERIKNLFFKKSENFNFFDRHFSFSEDKINKIYREVNEKERKGVELIKKIEKEFNIEETKIYVDYAVKYYDLKNKYKILKSSNVTFEDFVRSSYFSKKDSKG